jgi:drug/metabolite transporter (DMT)-like permease
MFQISSASGGIIVRQDILGNKRWQPSPYLMLFIGVMAVSTASLFIRYAQANHASSIVIAAVRLTLASVILTPFTLRNYRTELHGLSRLDLGMAFVSGILLAIHFASWITSLEHISVLVSVVLVTTNPLFVALFAPYLLGERIQRRTLVGILIAFGGGILVSFSSDSGASVTGGNTLLGSTLAVVGAIAAALYLIIGRKLRASLSLIPYIWLVYSTAAVILMLAVFAAGDNLTGYTPDTYFWMLMLAIVPQLIGHSSFNYALGHISAAYVSLVILGEPLGSALLAFLFLGEIPGWLQIAGAALILFAVAFAQQPEQPHAEIAAHADVAGD